MKPKKKKQKQTKNKAKNKIKLLIFDIDGVLADVSESYRLSIKKTAEFFIGRIIDMGEVEYVKNTGINNDWDAAEILIQKYNGDFRKEAIIKKFQEYYLGRNFDGLIRNEKLLIKAETIKKLSKKYKLAIFTGRPRQEAEFILSKYRLSKYFKSVVAMDDVKEQKPDPEGLLKIMKKLNVKIDEAVYIGDNLADLRAAKSIGIKFIGVCPPNADKLAIKKLFKSEGAETVLNGTNEIAKILK